MNAVCILYGQNMPSVVTLKCFIEFSSACVYSGQLCGNGWDTLGRRYKERVL